MEHRDEDQRQKDTLTNINNEDFDRNEMTREEALAFFGLDESSGDYDLEQKYYQYIKKFRSNIEANSDDLSRINDAYEIATGKRNKIVQERNMRENSRKVLGKTRKEWGVHFYYSWWKYILLGFVFGSFIFVIYHFFFTPNVDFTIIAFGHFENVERQIVDFTEEKFTFKRPQFMLANLIADNSEQTDEITMYGELTTAAYLSVEHDILITDRRTIPIFLPNFAPMDDFYDELKKELSEEQLEAIQPVIFSMADYYKLISELSEENPEIADEDHERHIYGLMITDPELILAMGFENRWRSDPPTLVFGISLKTEDREKSEEFIRTILIQSDWFIENDR